MDILSSKNRYSDISIIIPVYREGEKIRSLLTKVKEIVSSIPVSSYEIVIVDDGSDDNTLNILNQEKDRNVHVISYQGNKGKGYAVRQGIIYSKGDNVIFIDGDLDVSPSTIPEYIAGLSRYDLVIGSKSHPLSQVHAPSSRRLLSFTFNTIVRHCFSINIRDTQTGLKGGKGDILRAIFKVMSVNHYAFDVELLSIATYLNLSIKELPVEIRHSNNLKLFEIVRMFFDLMSILYRYRIKGSYQKKLADMKLRIK